MLKSRRRGKGAYLGYQKWNEQFKTYDLVIGSKSNWRSVAGVYVTGGHFIGIHLLQARISRRRASHRRAS
jgi:hypothetical protein